VLFERANRALGMKIVVERSEDLLGRRIAFDRSEPSPAK